MSDEWTLTADNLIRIYTHAPCGVKMLFSNRATDEGIKLSLLPHRCLPLGFVYQCSACLCDVPADEAIESLGGFQHEICCQHVSRVTF